MNPTPGDRAEWEKVMAALLKTMPDSYIGLVDCWPGDEVIFSLGRVSGWNEALTKAAEEFICHWSMTMPKPPCNDCEGCEAKEKILALRRGEAGNEAN